MSDMPARVWIWHDGEEWESRNCWTSWEPEISLATEYTRTDLAKEQADAAYLAGFEAAKRMAADHFIGLAKVFRTLHVHVAETTMPQISAKAILALTPRDLGGGEE